MPGLKRNLGKSFFRSGHTTRIRSRVNRRRARKLRDGSVSQKPRGAVIHAEIWPSLIESPR
jgi:hypothetical protein